MRDAPADAASGDLAAARKAGWRRADLAWEQLQEAGNAALQAGDWPRAARHFRRARWIALLRFNGRDPRRATTLANLALADRLAGREARAQRRYTRARRLWAGVDAFIAGMRIAQRARSSQFHLRMQARHRETYAQNMRVRMTAISRDTAAALAALERGEPVPCRLHARWRGEKPPVFDDTRKLLAAALLVAVPPPGGAG
ncbi:MAG TPA: tetratricopeptide repeat-containing protein [Thermohalobaculum sp.]|nr:tetratricopeptide repeat-containing protein [Thermohalobaculum sp.]